MDPWRAPLTGPLLVGFLSWRYRTDESSCFGWCGRLRGGVGSGVGRLVESSQGRFVQPGLWRLQVPRRLRWQDVLQRWRLLRQQALHGPDSLHGSLPWSQPLPRSVALPWPESVHGWQELLQRRWLLWQQALQWSAPWTSLSWSVLGRLRRLRQVAGARRSEWNADKTASPLRRESGFFVGDGVGRSPRSSHVAL